MAITLNDIQELIDQINQFRHPEIKFYGSNGLLYIVTKNTGFPVGPNEGTNKRDAYWFLKGMLAGVGAERLNDAEQKKAFNDHLLFLDAKDHFMDYICYENVVDDPEALSEFAEDYGCKPDAFLDHTSPQYLIGAIIASFVMVGGKNKPHGEQQQLMKSIIQNKLEEIKSNRSEQHG